MLSVLLPGLVGSYFCKCTKRYLTLPQRCLWCPFRLGTGAGTHPGLFLLRGTMKLKEWTFFELREHRNVEGGGESSQARRRVIFWGSAAMAGGWGWTPGCRPEREKRRRVSGGDAWRMQGKCGAGSLMYSFPRAEATNWMLETTESILSQMPRLEIQTQVDSGFARPLLTLGEDPSCLSQSLVALGILGWWFHHSNLCPHLHMASPAMPLPLKSPGWPGGQWLGLHLTMQRVRVWSLVGELRPHIPRGQNTKIKKQNKTEARFLT